MVDRLRFRSVGEVSLYRALCAQQAQQPEFGGFSIAVNAAVRVAGRTWEVDFLVVHCGRAAVIEVDGHHHGTRWCADRSRDRILEDAGIAFVERIPVEDTSNATELTTVVRRVLYRLAQRP